jgi:hypothetical protein
MEITPTEFQQANPVQADLPKIFREQAIMRGTFLGGPLAAGYLIAHNFKVFGEKDKVRNTWIISILATVLIFYIILHLAASVKIPNQVIPFLYSGIAYGLVAYYQSKNIESHLKERGQYYNGWRVAGTSIIALLITCAGVFSCVYFTDPTFTASRKEYGITKNQILYKKADITDQELDKMADSFKAAGLFGDELTVSVLIEKKNSDYTISIPLQKDAWNDPNTVNGFQALREGVQANFPNGHIRINLTSTDIGDVKKTLD